MKRSPYLRPLGQRLSWSKGLFQTAKVLQYYIKRDGLQISNFALYARGGENIFPREIEGILHAHPRILEAAVIGLPDPDWGEKVHAVVALKEGETLTEQLSQVFVLSKFGR
ncbi:MAG: hypothetical protein ISS68_09065 [Desulfobacteraceae bacterium]|nr:hypothetical protein [Desulfobacteraceae bacterium]